MPLEKWLGGPQGVYDKCKSKRIRTYLLSRIFTMLGEYGLLSSCYSDSSAMAADSVQL